MNRIQLREIMEDQGLTVKQLAAEIFPHVNNKEMALRRVINGEQELTESQIYKLSAVTSIPVQALYNGINAKASYSDGVHTFIVGEYTAKLNTKNWTTTVYHNGRMEAREIVHAGAMPLSEYFGMLKEYFKEL